MKEEKRTNFMSCFCIIEVRFCLFGVFKAIIFAGIGSDNCYLTLGGLKVHAVSI